MPFCLLSDTRGTGKAKAHAEIGWMAARGLLARPCRKWTGEDGGRPGSPCTSLVRGGGCVASPLLGGKDCRPTEDMTGRRLPGRESILVGSPEGNSDPKAGQDVDRWTQGGRAPCAGRGEPLSWVGWRAGPHEERKGNDVRPEGPAGGLVCRLREWGCDEWSGRRDPLSSHSQTDQQGHCYTPRACGEFPLTAVRC